MASFNSGVAVACAGVLIFTRFLRVLQVQFESNIQHLSNDEARATISSIGSFGAKLVAAGIVAVVGLFAVDDLIVEPLRIALVTGAVVFIAVHTFIRYKQRQNTETFVKSLASHQAFTRLQYKCCLNRL